LLPEQKEKYLRAVAARKAKSAENVPSSSTFKEISSTRLAGGAKAAEGKKKSPKRPHDMTDGERELYLEERARCKEKERLAARAKNMSGLTIDEKEALSALPSPA
jgi:hypothetical protein